MVVDINVQLVAVLNGMIAVLSGMITVLVSSSWLEVYYVCDTWEKAF